MKKVTLMQQQLGYKELSPIQKLVIKHFDDQRNLVALAPTGTGKTHAYLLPLLAKLDLNNKNLQAIILVPTNELAIQVFKMVSQIEHQAVIKAYYGAIDLNKEVKWLTNNTAQIVITTPAKLFELVRTRNALNIQNTNYFVLDEADMMFDEQFLSIIDATLSKINIGKYILLSATINQQMDTFIKKYFGQYLLLEPKMEQLKIEQRLLKVTNDRLATLMAVIERINPYLALIFVSKKEDMKIVYEHLLDNGLNVCLVSSDIDVKKRRKLITEIHDLKYQYVVASDLMARGIDFKCSHVINYDLPNNLEFFTHRSGRTGRMGDSGIVITIQTSDDQRKIQKLKNQGTEFINYVLTDDGFKKIVKPTGPVLTDDEKNKLKQVKTGKKVKPNYKKKHQAAVKKQLQQIKKKRYQNETKNR